MIKGDASQGKKPIIVLSRYSELVGKAAEPTYLKTISTKIRTGLSEAFAATLDARARARPMAYHHLYEWGAVGHPTSRLFKITGSGHGTANFTLSYSLLPSSKPVPGSNDVFALKADIMENSVTVVIRPRDRVLVFDSPGGTVFTTRPVVVKNPGGRAVAGSMESAFSAYFNPASVDANPIYNSIIEASDKEIQRRVDVASRA